jgi:2-C-methyl-D-erythritol 4-phosphate cytidylyltransferase
MKITAIIAAAGYGTRMHTPGGKQFLELAGKPILQHTLEIFSGCDAIDEIVLTVNPDDLDKAKSFVRQNNFTKVIAVVPGGKERQNSVYNALLQVHEDTNIVLVHDGARPLVTKELIVRIASEIKIDDAVIPGVPVKDTTKTVKDGIVQNTLDRKSLMSIQTPQAFRFKLLKEAYERGRRTGYLATDDARFIERLGHKVKVVPGSYENIKITTPEDIIIAEAIIQKRVQAVRE